MRRIARKLAIASAVVLVTLGVGEIAARLLVRGSHDAEAARVRAVHTVDRMVGDAWSAPRDDEEARTTPQADHRPVVHPFYGYDDARSDADLTRDLEHYASERAQRTYDVLVLGGSVAGGFLAACRAPLCEALEADPAWRGWSVRVQSACQGGFRQPQQLHALQYLLTIGCRPDLVVSLDGFNEVALGLQNARAGVHPIMPSVHHWLPLVASGRPTPLMIDALAAIRREQRGARWLLARAHSLGLFRSALLALGVQTALDGSYARYVKACGNYQQLLEGSGAEHLAGPSFQSTDEAALELSVRVWKESSRAMQAICRANGIRFLHVLQPTLHDEGAKPATDEELAASRGSELWAQGARLGYPLLRAAGAGLAAEGVQLLDASRVFADVRETLYFDVCHFVPEGHAILLEHVLEAIRATPPGPPPATGGASRR